MNKNKRENKKGTTRNMRNIKEQKFKKKKKNTKKKRKSRKSPRIFGEQEQKRNNSRTIRKNVRFENILIVVFGR